MNSNPGSDAVEVPAQRRFSATWTDVFENPGTRMITGDFFSLDAGYENADIENIASLAVGETWQSEDYGSAHTVTRLPD